MTFAIVPTVGYLVLTYADTLIGKLDPTVILPTALTADLTILRAVGHGFILTAILWGGLLAHLIDGKLRRASVGFFLCAAFAMFGVIHSVTQSGEIYFPWNNGSGLIWQITLGYAIVGAVLLIGSLRTKKSF